MLPSLIPEPRNTPRGAALEKLQNFLIDHALEGRPVLVLQCAPRVTQRFEVDGVSVLRAMLNGACRQLHGAWWLGFMGSASPVKVFDGLRSGGTTTVQGWGTEFHADGRVIAGIQADARSSNPQAIFGAITMAFADFARLTVSLYEAIKFSGEVVITAALVGCKDLPVHRNPNRAPTGTTLSRNFYEWPLESADGHQAIEEACKRMEDKLERLF